LNKLWYIHKMEYYISVKKTEEDLYELMWNDFQDLLLSVKSKEQGQMQWYTPVVPVTQEAKAVEVPKPRNLKQALATWQDQVS
jgi:hypothetical protein